MCVSPLNCRPANGTSLDYATSHRLEGQCLSETVYPTRQEFEAKSCSNWATAS